MNIFKKTNPVVLWTMGVLVVLVVGGCWYLGGWSGMMTTWKQWWYLGQIENLKEAYRQDTYGAATPEGTLKLFVDAFQKGDVDLASKYFVVEKQGEYKTKITNWIKSPLRDNLFKSLTNSKRIDNRGNSIYAEMSEVDNNGNIIHSIEFRLNESSKLWKIFGM